MTIPITDKFEASSGKGNFKLTWPEEMDAGAFDIALTFASGGSIDATGTTGEIIIQTGAIVPVHSASQSVMYWDTAAKKLYINNDGASGWTEIGSGAGATGATGPQGAQGDTGLTGQTGATGPAGTTIHSELSDLTVGDDHTQYALLAGRSGGQTLIGGTASGNDLVLQSTTNVTQGYIILDTDAGLSSGRVGIGQSSPDHFVDIVNNLNVIGDGTIDVSAMMLSIKKDETIAGSFGQGPGLGFGGHNTGTNIGAAIAHETTDDNSQGKLHFATKGETGVASDIPIRMTVDDFGRVGIGTTTPESGFHIANTGISATVFIDGETGVDGIKFPDRTIQTTAATGAGLTNDHSDLNGLLADDHTQYALADGTRDFTGTVGGIDPVADDDLATKLYVDELVIPVDYVPSTLNVPAPFGTLQAGNVDSLAVIDDADAIEVDEEAETPGFTIEMDFFYVTEIPTRLDLHAYYTGGSGHTVNVQIYDHQVADDWETLGTISDAGGDFDYMTFDIINGSKYINGDVVNTRINHEDAGNPTHEIFVDLALLRKIPVGGGGGITDHGNLAGLGDDDHAQYLRTDGTRELTGDWDAGTNIIETLGNITGGKLVSTAASPTPPLTVGSTGAVANLVSQYLQGPGSFYFPWGDSGNTIPICANVNTWSGDQVLGQSGGGAGSSVSLQFIDNNRKIQSITTEGIRITLGATHSLAVYNGSDIFTVDDDEMIVSPGGTDVLTVDSTGQTLTTTAAIFFRNTDQKIQSTSASELRVTVATGDTFSVRVNTTNQLQVSSNGILSPSEIASETILSAKGDAASAYGGITYTGISTKTGGKTGTATLGLMGDKNTPTTLAQWGWLKIYLVEDPHYLAIWI